MYVNIQIMVILYVQTTFTFGGFRTNFTGTSAAASAIFELSSAINIRVLTNII